MKKGFTLIELLAVIVILAIISLIATPVILNIINNVKEESNKRSVEMYYKSLELSIVNASLKNIKIESGEYSIMIDGNLCLGQLQNNKCNSNVLEIKLDGQKPTSGEIIIENEKIISVQLVLNNKQIGKFKNSNFGYVEYNVGTPVYFDVSKGVGCTKKQYESSYDDTISDYSNSTTGYNGVNGTGNQNSCLKFYVIEDLGGALNLILDHNTTAAVAWIDRADFADDYKWGHMIYNSKGPLTLLKQLKQDTKDWNGTIEPMTYVTKERHTESYEYSIDYTGYNARIITANEIAQIVEYKGWDENSGFTRDWYYFEDQTQNSTTGSKDACANTDCKFYWLYDRTNYCPQMCEDTILKTSGYWTASSKYGDTAHVWFIHYDGRIWSTTATVQWGIRPVITIPKINM